MFWTHFILDIYAQSWNILVPPSFINQWVIIQIHMSANLIKSITFPLIIPRKLAVSLNSVICLYLSYYEIFLLVLMKDTLHENINPLVISKGKKIMLAMLLIEKIASLGAMTFLPSWVNDEVLESTKKKKKYWVVFYALGAIFLPLRLRLWKVGMLIF